MKIDKCDLCNRKRELFCVVYSPGTILTGTTLFICEECNLSVLSQHYNFSNDAINNYINWKTKW